MALNPEQAAGRILEHLAVLNPDPAAGGPPAGWVAAEVVDRALLWLNAGELPEALMRPLAGVCAGLLERCASPGGAGARAVVSVSDNGQSVSWSVDAANFLATASDAEVFTGALELMRRYRRINVV